MRKQALIFWVLIGLAAIGIANSMLTGGILNWLIPVILVAAVFLLYKFPPAKYRSKSPKVKPSVKTMAKIAKTTPQRRSDAAPKRKHYPFQVIEGNKGKNEDGQQPKYH